MIDVNRVHKLFESVFRVLEGYKENSKKAREYGAGEKLYPSEIHLVMMIGHNQDVNVTKLAEIAGITKGAVSQTLAKLEKKGLVEREDDPDNASRIQLRLTDKGMKAHMQHMKMHQKMHEEVATFLTGLSAQQFETLERFFMLMENLMKSMK